ncbi:MAG: MFS transporter, partial [Thermoleophilaceae bacterium]
GWSSAATIGSVGGGLVLLAASVRRALSHPAPALETSLWRNRMFAAANFTSLVIGAAVYTWLLLCVLFLTNVWHYSVLKAGLAVSPGAFTSAAAAIASGRVMAVRGPRPVVIGGALLLGVVGAWCAVALGTHPNFLTFWGPAGATAGVAMGAAMTGSGAAAATSVSSARFAAGTGLNMTARQLGGALGIATLAAILTAQGPTVAAFRDVFLFCTGAAVVASLCAVGLAPARSASAAGAGLADRDGRRASVAPAHLT